MVQEEAGMIGRARRPLPRRSLPNHAVVAIVPPAWSEIRPTAPGLRLETEQLSRGTGSTRSPSPRPRLRSEAGVAGQLGSRLRARARARGCESCARAGAQGHSNGWPSKRAKSWRRSKPENALFFFSGGGSPELGHYPWRTLPWCGCWDLRSFGTLRMLGPEIRKAHREEAGPPRRLG